MEHTTIKEIARLSGVSIATVSRAVNPHTAHFVKHSTRNKILRLVKKTHYLPSPAAQRLVTGKSYNIALFLGVKYRTVFYHDYYVKLMAGVMDGLENTPYSLIVRMLKLKECRFDFNEMIKGLDIAGSIVCHLKTELEVSTAGLQGLKMPVVILNMTGNRKGVRFIAYDHLEAAYEATKYLIGLGHTKIAIIKGPDIEPDAVKRFDGFKRALRDNHIALNSLYIHQGQFNEATGFSGMDNFLSLKDKPTAVFCSNDEIAIGAFMKLNETGLSCPRDMSLIGFDGIDATRYAIPSLTTMRQPIYEMAKEAAEFLVSALENKRTMSGTKIFTPQLTEGGTCEKSAPAVYAS